MALVGIEPTLLRGSGFRDRCVYQFRHRAVVEVTGLEPVGRAWLGRQPAICYPHRIGGPDVSASGPPIFEASAIFSAPFRARTPRQNLGNTVRKQVEAVGHEPTGVQLV